MGNICCSQSDVNPNYNQDGKKPANKKMLLDNVARNQLDDEEKLIESTKK